MSFAIGVALGRFGANGEGILDTAPPNALPAGILFIAPDDHYADSLKHPATAPLLAACDEHQQLILAGKKQDLRNSDALRKRFLADNKALARELQATETKRRERKAAKGEADEQDPSEPDDNEVG